MKLRNVQATAVSKIEYSKHTFRKATSRTRRRPGQAQDHLPELGKLSRRGVVLFRIKSVSALLKPKDYSWKLGLESMERLHSESAAQ
ncbi:hypothetical protein E2C01_081173 [Portunus trituberculatus]|uniref:Uncharacterized protein n=1 Tax=Portunus trituberculatus TaxID=210409 RepID=A0A5B7IVX6_PORTR|nr:hypothetical protein [Portunus trituberculatus]